MLLTKRRCKLQVSRRSSGRSLAICMRLAISSLTLMQCSLPIAACTTTETHRSLMSSSSSWRGRAVTIWQERSNWPSVPMVPLQTGQDRRTKVEARLARPPRPARRRQFHIGAVATKYGEGIPSHQRGRSGRAPEPLVPFGCGRRGQLKMQFPAADSLTRARVPKRDRTRNMTSSVTRKL